MPGLTKVASYPSQSLSPRRSTLKPPPSASDSNETNLPASPGGATLPRIQLAHGARRVAPGNQWSFLHTLLSQDEEEGNEDARESGGRQTTTSLPRVRDASPSRLPFPETASRTSPRDRRLPGKTEWQRAQLPSEGLRKSGHVSGGEATSEGKLSSERKLSGDLDMRAALSAPRAAPSSQPFPPTASDNRKTSRVGAGDNATASDDAPQPMTSSMAQWTTCRALPDLEDEDPDNADVATFDADADFDLDPSSCSPAGDHSPIIRSPPAAAGLSNVAAGAALSRAASNVSVGGGGLQAVQARRKRPLLLPPIMLPPIYTVKPTPLRFRDSVLDMASSPRGPRPITDEEWDQLWDCRYIRHRPFKVSLSA